MTAACPECGVALAPGQTCRELFHALLALEAEIPGGPGELAHFYAIASYGVQHPEGMGHTEEALAGMRTALERVVGGVATIEDMRRAIRFKAEGVARVTRRPGDPVPRWRVDRWSFTVGDVLAGGAHSYRTNVESWARSVSDALNRAHPGGPEVP